MNGLNERIGVVIESLGMKKTAFAERLNVSQAFISQLCSGAKQPSDRTIMDICREFNVNETWLRTGEGEPFKPLTRSQAIMDFAADLINEDESFKARLIGALAKLSEDEWEILEGIAKKLAENKKD